MALWTEADDAFLRESIAQGLSSSQIASQMPGRTRNSIIGRAERTGLKLPGWKGRAPRVERKNRPGVIHSKIRAIRNPPKPKPIVPLPDPAAAITVMAMPRHGRCRYPAWPNNARFTADESVFCGMPTKPASSYCEHHHAICCTVNRVTHGAKLHPVMAESDPVAERAAVALVARCGSSESRPA